MKMKTIKSRMIAYYTLLILSVCITAFVFIQMNRNWTEHKIGEVSGQTLIAIQTNMQSLFQNTDKYSQRIIASKTIQRILEQNNNTVDVAATNRIVQNTLFEIVLAEPTISSIYLFPQQGDYYSLNNSGLHLQTSNIRALSWYKEAIQKDGAGIWRMNGGGLFAQTSNEEPVLSLIRTVNSLYTMKPLGILVINIPLSQVENSYNQSLSKGTFDLMVSRPDVPLVHFTDPTLLEYSKSGNVWSSMGTNRIVSIHNERYLLSTSELDQWKYALVLPTKVLANSDESINRNFMIIIIILCLLFLSASIWLSQTITRPLMRLLKSMIGMKIGKYKPVVLLSAPSEIWWLQKRYNMMLEMIKQSRQREQEEQRVRARLELEILHQQVKPHFLYNALESAGYLSLSGNKQSSYHLISTLSKFYRQSLNSGNEVVSLQQEFDITRHYLTIQMIRYPDLFTVEYELDEAVEQLLIPKLSIQPLVENALYHGIRPTGQKGHIRLAARLNKMAAIITVSDDGMGMHTDQMTQLSEGQLLEQRAVSFGLHGTLTRLKLYYKNNFSYKIDSEYGKGTIIQLILPLQMKERE